MKRIIGILFLTLNLATASDVKDIEYVSYVNFGIPALSVKNNSHGKIEIAIKSGLLSYSDTLADPELADRLADIYGLGDLNSIIVEFPKEACVTKSTTSLLEGQILTCSILNNPGEQIEFFGAVHDLHGELVTRSKKSFLGRLKVEVLANKVISATSEYQQLDVKLSGTLPIQEGLDKYVPFYQTKAGIGENKF